ncbi:MAG: hypothetical protein A2268_01980 [Candidatus Raymondbacteria bacterium RifOxyA12_full_50_37]|uniref:Uncharacterized protein n=1 Tax=Candidatus Raymondbacteria bacterium RIFOXYD12_FULL_49_13 TaxID=1817890 RepID=A0A1F7F620_UNCRA|nr:MAG: hypothetical protein A2268_01980 [Candidatus Raymondbacteria bacterium RifOxyA12_full_50_37]OGJ92112.1 MAG: hypothetical protein A2248_10810 [Candidatus Raymondbacteria bacterium RIFOXYA2_FULL_49_16]OGJ93482.1 MAG: hypothetical protein A2487_20690 [Candidatus Raymondbacteria bacterium RifOxyC12_full_50_8]OGJ98468.1 MAG: hypothetical protein A2453_07050 [Candidatus Raymondbacteria bacterium RIFOXYC2_FULL_50_21]OGK00247.1 MAG: hypothetical protein A2350_05130 [Candidatus Raymondbacteria b
MWIKFSVKGRTVSEAEARGQHHSLRLRSANGAMVSYCRRMISFGGIILLFFANCVRFETITPVAPEKKVTVAMTPWTLVDGTGFGVGESKFFTDTAYNVFTFWNHSDFRVNFSTTHSCLYRDADMVLPSFLLKFDLKVATWDTGAMLYIGFTGDTAVHGAMDFTGIAIERHTPDSLLFALVSEGEWGPNTSVSLIHFDNEWVSYLLTFANNRLVFSENKSVRNVLPQDIELLVQQDNVPQFVAIRGIGTYIEFYLDNVYLYK